MKLDTVTLTDFSELSDAQKLSVLNWRNNENVREWMYTKKNISEKEHFAFIQKLKNDTSKRYFLVSMDNSVGVIYFIDIDKEKAQAKFGLYTKPGIKGYGSMLMSAICQYGFEVLDLKRLLAEVFERNEKAIALYQKFGLQQFSSKIIEGKKILCMELVNENR